MRVVALRTKYALVDDWVCSFHRALCEAYYIHTDQDSHDSPSNVIPSNVIPNSNSLILNDNKGDGVVFQGKPEV